MADTGISKEEIPTFPECDLFVKSVARQKQVIWELQQKYAILHSPWLPFICLQISMKRTVEKILVAITFTKPSHQAVISESKRFRFSLHSLVSLLFYNCKLDNMEIMRSILSALIPPPTSKWALG